MTKLTWDNAAMIAKRDADKLGVTTGDIIEITAGSRKLRIAAYVMPGQPVGVIALPLGYGHTTGSPIAGTVENPLGFNTYVLRTTDALETAHGAQVTRTGETYKLALTQNHHIIDAIGESIREKRVGDKHQSGRYFYESTLENFKAKGRRAFEPPGHHAVIPLQLFDPPKGSAGPKAHDEAPSFFNFPHAWGMAIDTNACVGCNGCVIACQAENNVPVVGKDNVLSSREMHWLRIDRYFKGDAEDPQVKVVHQPMMCVHCENAPCEQVCPVAATMHDTEGLNVMVYNRCIGTRYCSNNCPYKVRRFNYFDWNAHDPRGGYYHIPYPGMPDAEQGSIDPIRQMAFNPDVTVRMRGVMEKCTYCVQRVSRAKIARRNADEEVQDGDVVTACQQACPTQAIVFGNLNDPNSEVMKLHRSKRSYGVLAELNTRPRTLHLARVSNPIAGETDSTHGDDSKEHG
jgi:molybdopterin-containing oxidoreductase family iron-sulfur binding subunit